ncbi:site-specific integrase [uncultured Paraglaciecola sp.]|uniref:site-specific integrase n=1 Tax=uncultured Paraglaciecola sp. TaxID=1765024 RepID=UPI0025DF19A2|nr:site-specific integrase [uncultured Paraglaciecola sp.]
MTQVNETVNPLRQRMIDDMNMRKLSPKTQIGYIRAVARFAKYLKYSPAQAASEELRQFQIALAEQGTSKITINATLSGLQFLYCKTLNRPDIVDKLSAVPTPRKLPQILSLEEVERPVRSRMRGVVGLEVRDIRLPD